MIKRMTTGEIWEQMKAESQDVSRYSDIWPKLPEWSGLPRQGQIVSVSGNKVTFTSTGEVRITLPATPEIIDLIMNEGFPDLAVLYFTTDKGMINKMLIVLSL